MASEENDHSFQRKSRFDLQAQADWVKLLFQARTAHRVRSKREFRRLGTQLDGPVAKILGTRGHGRITRQALDNDNLKRRFPKSSSGPVRKSFSFH